jgi:3-isopropylmalate/(R)-2-methylmalate dehydratase large subunit
MAIIIRPKAEKSKDEKPVNAEDRQPKLKHSKKPPMTMTQKILAAHAGLDFVKPGQFIEANLDAALANDITGPVAIREFERMGAKRVFDNTKIMLVPDHFTPNKDIKAAEQAKELRDFAKKQGIVNYFEVGVMGIEHALLPEQGLVAAGDVVIGADSHTCTYGALGAFATGIGSTDMAAGMVTGKAWFKVPSAIRFELTGKPGKWVSGKDVILHIIGKIGVDGALYKSMEFTGSGLENLSMDDRFAMANMAIEAGAKNGIFPVDDKTRAYMRAHRSKTAEKHAHTYVADSGAEYENVFEIDLSRIKPTVSFPHLPDNTRTADKAGNVKIDQVVIGSCTNGRLEDMAVAAKILKRRRVADGVRCIIIPATQRVYLDCVQLGYAETFIKAGAVFSTPTCGPCLGGHMGILAAGERAVSTTNRNFVGRMGHTDSEVYLASPAVAAASAVMGKIVDPEKLLARKRLSPGVPFARTTDNGTSQKKQKGVQNGKSI